MRVQVTIILPYSPPVPTQVVEQLLGIAPPSESSRPTDPWWRLDADDPRLAPLLSTLHAAGITEEPSEETSRPSVVRRLVRLVLPNRGKRAAPESKPHYRVVRIRRYEPSDCVGVAFFEPDSAVRAPTKNGRTADGRLQIDFFGAKEMSPAERAAPLLVGHCGVLVPARVKQLLEGAGFKGMVFRPTALGRTVDDDRTTEVKWRRAGLEPLWEWRSDITMPWVALEQTVMDATTRLPLGRTEKRSDRFVYIKPEPTFNRAELIYSQRELDAALPPECDAAMTRERTWKTPEDECSQLIVSARFREWWLRQGLAADNWIPVRVVP